MTVFSRSRLREAQLDYANYYLQELQQWEMLFRQTLDPVSLLNRITPDLQQIRQAQRWSALHTDKMDEAAVLCSAFGLTDTALLELHEGGAGQITWYEEALYAASCLEDQRAEHQHRYALALSYGRVGQYRRMVEHLTELLKVKDIDDTFRAKLHNALGDALANMGESQQAEAEYQFGLHLSAHTSTECAHAHWGLASVYTTLSQHEQALDHYTQCIDLYQQAGNLLRLAQTYTRLGELAYNQGDYTTAERYQQQSIAIAEPLGHTRSLTMAYRNLGYITMDRGLLSDAEIYFARSLDHCQQLGDLREHAIITGGLGQLRWRSGDVTGARSAFRESIACCEQTGDQIGMAYTLINLSQVNQHEGDIQQSLYELEQASAILARLGDSWGQAKVLMLLGELAEAQADFTRAQTYFAEMLTLVEAVGDARGQALAHVGLARTALASGQTKQIIGHVRHTLALISDIDYQPALFAAWLVLLRWWLSESKMRFHGFELAGFMLANPALSTPMIETVRGLMVAFESKDVDDILAQGASRLSNYFTQLLDKL
jgi:tetratricopeptide (TPR) repeat protein